ncbi:Cthe_2314 family HEPN domain-containing protein [Vibrio salinus]|uniref:Cthe_2314 family HEPN domain-containing protein n=1 Tax=Vibrio salinus TaxID=2899784 RepID=UPI001E3DCBE2|nr:Cthe_2314 family HEPN domain-containing protein [Vibrio salinus]MCE0494652.1 hypothetical protein [Vibrio salinus]
MLEIIGKYLLDEDSPLKRAKFIDGRFTYIPESNVDNYIIECGKAVAAIDHAVDKSKQCLSLINYEYIRLINNDEYNLADYIEFHIENYIIRTHSIYDRTLIFINKLLQLGIDNSHIGHELLVSNENVKKYKINESMKSLKKRFKKYHNIRNMIIHHDKYNDEEFEEISLYHKTNELLERNNQKEMINKEVLDFVTEDYLKEKLQELSSNLDSILEQLVILLEQSFEVYEGKKRQLKVT